MKLTNTAAVAVGGVRNLPLADSSVAGGDENEASNNRAVAVGSLYYV
jgi:hypothetical protein